MSRAARRRLVGLALALVLALPLAADAQLVSPDRDPQRETPADEARIRLTRELLRLQRLTEQDPAAARARLVQLRAEHPDHPQLELLLARADRLTGAFDESEAILRRLLERYPQSSGYRSELVTTLFRAGRLDEARDLARAIYRDEKRAGAYEEAASLLLDLGRPDMAEDVYRDGLAAVPTSDPRGRLRLMRRLLELFNLEGAPGKVLDLVARDGESLTDANLRARLVNDAAQFLREAEQPRSLLPLADSLAAGPSGDRLAPLLREIYLAVGDHTRYAEQVLRAKVPGEVRAEWLLDAGIRCLEDPRGDAARRRAAADRLFTAGLDEADNALQRARLRYQLARLRLEEDGERRLAGDTPSAADVSALRDLLAALRREQPGSEWATRALVDELRLLRDRLGEVAAADSLLRAWFLEPDRARGVSDAALEMELGENLMAAGEFDAARGHYESLRREDDQPELVSLATFRLAELQVLAGETAAAQDSLAALAKAAPGASLANDALDLALLLAESATWPQAVQRHLASAFALEFRHQPAAAAKALLGFATEFPEDPASAPLLYRAGQLQLRALDGDGAMASWLLLADEHPDDFRAPQALEQAARLAFRRGRLDESRALLERVMTEHPGFPLRPGMRDLQDRLREDA